MTGVQPITPSLLKKCVFYNVAAPGLVVACRIFQLGQCDLLVAALGSSSLTRDQNRAPGIQSAVLVAGPPGESHNIFI